MGKDIAFGTFEHPFRGLFVFSHGVFVPKAYLFPQPQLIIDLSFEIFTG
jgi:hypothetical protein